MDSLPLHLVEMILFKSEPKSLAMMQCTNRCIRSFISDDNSNFITEYLTRLSGLIHISSFGSTFLFWHSSSGDRPRSTRCHFEVTSQILGSCSGLLLLYVDSLCVANPFTKSFQFLGGGMIENLHRMNHIGFAVDQIDRTTQIFKVVRLIDFEAFFNLGTRKYRFHINEGDSSWRFSKSTITCNSSNLREMKPVYSNGTLHWLRNDGSIIIFDIKTEEARLIPIESPQNLSWKILFTAVKNELALISATKEVIFIYSLENIHADPKWVLVRRIKNRQVVTEERLRHCQVAAYDGESLLVKDGEDSMVHRYDLRANRWRVMCPTPIWCDAPRDYYQFKPSLCSVIGLNGDEVVEMAHANGGDKTHKRLESVRRIMRLVADISPHASELIKKKRKLEK